MKVFYLCHRHMMTADTFWRKILTLLIWFSHRVIIKNVDANNSLLWQRHRQTNSSPTMASIKKGEKYRIRHSRGSKFFCIVGCQVYLYEFFHFFFSLLLLLHFDCLIYYFSFLLKIRFRLISISSKNYKMDFSYQKKVSTFTSSRAITRFSANDGWRFKYYYFL